MKMTIDPLPKSSLFVQEAHRGDVPAARFGHTTTLVSEGLVILFGGATGEGGSYQINNEVYALDYKRLIWRRLHPGGPAVPAPRAAHAAASVDVNQMVVYGGAVGGGGLCQEDLHLLDNRSDPQWLLVPVEGPTPGKRYGHTMIYSRPNLIVFGGNDGLNALNDVWTMDAEKAPFMWHRLEMINPHKIPCARVYHSAEMCITGPASGMMVVFGGRSVESKSLKDTWGLRQHRDGRWDWIEAPSKRGNPPEARFQHSCCFHKSKMFVFGGRTGDVNKTMPTSIYDTETCEWRDLESTERFRHSTYTVGNFLYVYGGFNHQASSVPTADLRSFNLDLDITSHFHIAKKNDVNSSITEVALSMAPNLQQRPQSVSYSLDRSSQGLVSPLTAQVSLHHKVYVSMDGQGAQQIGIDSLEEEHKRTNNKLANVMGPKDTSSLATFVCEQLLQPSSWRPNPAVDHTKFFLQSADIIELCNAVENIFNRQPIVLKVRAPIKVYGDIHGQFGDLMRLFSRYGSPAEPSEGGDIDAMDYLFLGDYVDRGAYSLETVCLLFALKIRHPLQIHLIRGNHEDSAINAIYGFKDECARRLGEDPHHPGSVWNAINRVFEWLPVGAVIDEKILCIHGGIGYSINKLSDLESMSRPLKVAQTPVGDLEQRVTDLLWSDPTDSDTSIGVYRNDTRDPDGSGKIYKFGPDRVESFLKNNQLSMIVRAHECVMDGFERFASGKLITVFSATDYCGHHKNAGALLYIRRDFTIVPKLIYPVDRLLSNANWDASNINLRPPTPPRRLMTRE